MNSTWKIFCRGVAETALVLVFLAGCDEPAQSSKPTTRPVAAAATAPPPDTSAILVSYPERPPCYLVIDGKNIPFPAAKLAVIGHGSGGYTLRLCSDDPPTAIDPGYAGNSYVLDMRLAMERLADLPSATFDYRPSDNADATSGIYIHGTRDQYQPSDVHITFQKNGDELMTFINGIFLHNDSSNPAAPAVRVQVSAALRTNLPAD